MFVTICGRFCLDEGTAAGYGNQICAKYTAKWGVQIAGMIFQTRFKQSKKYRYTSALLEVYRYFIHSLFSFIRHPQFFLRLYLKKVFCKMCITICGNDFSNTL